MPAQILNNPGYVIGLNQAILGSAPSNAVFQAQLDQANASNARTFAINYVNTLGDTNAVLAAKVLTNLGITNAPLQTALEQAFAAFQTARGAVVYRLLELLQNLEGDVTFGAAAATYNNAVTSNFAYSSDPNSLALRPTSLKTTNLTSATDVLNLVGNDLIINAGQVFVPGGNDRVNSLQDEDQISVTGTNATLNATLGNANDNGGRSITPTLNGVSTVNVAFTGNNGGNGGVNRLDLQDATGLTNAVNITRVTDTTNTVQVDNLLAAVTNLSIANSNSGTATIGINFADGALAGTADATTLTLNRVNVVGVSVEQTDNNFAGAVAGANTGFVGLDEGFETINLVSTGASNIVQVFSAEDLRTLNISGANNLQLGGTATTLVAANGTLIEATRYNAGLANVAGSLSSVDASALTGALQYNIGTEITSFRDDTSGLPINLNVRGGAGNDTFRLTLPANGVIAGEYGVQAGDSIDGGAGTNTLVIVAPANIAGTVSNVQALEIRSGHDADANQENVNVDATRITNLATTFIRNEGQTLAGVGAQALSASEDLVARVFNLTAAQATAITTAHGTTGNNDLTTAFDVNNILKAAPLAGTRINLDVGAGVTTAGITIVDGINTDPRYNFSLVADSDTEAGAVSATGIQANNRNGTNTVANLTITDNDTESQSIELVEVGRLTSDARGAAAGHSGTITVAGTSTGFLNLDASRNAYRYDQTGGDDDGGTAAGANNANGILNAGNAAINVAATNSSNNLATFGHRSGTANEYAERLISTTFTSEGYAGSLVIRVADADTANGGQAIRFGAGNDTVIFDQSNPGAINQRTAGLTISDTVSGGAGNDILAFDGNGVNISIGASEWTNVSGFEIVRLVGNGQAANNAFAALNNNGNAYNLTLTNELLANNGVQDGGIKRITIVNDNDASNDVANIANDTNARAANFGATGVEAGVNIDARVLSANNSFAYHGEEGRAIGQVDYNAGGAGDTADRFILADANINGAAIIDGGAGSNINTVTVNIDTDSVRNNDVIDVRNSAVVTLGDIQNVFNIGTFEFRNDGAVATSSLLELNDEAVDRLVDSFQASRVADAANNISQNQETLVIKALNNPTNAASTTTLTIQGNTMTGRSAVDVFLDRGANHQILTGGGNDRVVLLGGFNAGVYAQTELGEVINAYASNVANVNNFTGTINLGGQTGTALAGDNVNDVLVTYGAVNLAGGTLAGIEVVTANSALTMTVNQINALTRLEFTSATLAHTLSIVGTGAVDLSKIFVAAGSTVAYTLANGVTTTGVANAGVALNNAVGTLGDDVYTGDNNANTFDALGGNDILTGGAGADNLTGGPGNDTFRFTAVEFVVGTGLPPANAAAATAAASETIIGGDGIDTIQFTDQITAALATTIESGFGIVADNRKSGIEVIKLADGGNGTNAAPVLVGANTAISTFNLTVEGGSGADAISAGAHTRGLTLNTLAGIDTVSGSGFNDTIRGGADSDTLSGNAGSDRFVFEDTAANNGADVFTDFQAGVNGDVFDVSAFAIDGNATASLPVAAGIFRTLDATAPVTPTIINGQIARLVGGFANAGELNTAVAAGGSFANIDMNANGKAIIITAASTLPGANNVYFATSDNGGVITTVLVGTITNNVDIASYVNGNFLI